MLPLRTAIVVGFVVASFRYAGAQTAPPAGAPQANYRDQLRSEVDSLLRSGVTRPYGLAFPDAPDPGAKTPKVSFEPGSTPAAGLILELSGQLLDEPRYRDAAVQVARGLSLALDTAGRIPGSAQFLAGNLSQREAYGTVPRRPPTTATLAFLLHLDRNLATGATPAADSRITATAVRSANWLLKQQQRAGGFPTALETAGERFPKRIVLLDTPDARDTYLTLLLIAKSAEGRETLLPVAPARMAAERALTALGKQRFSEAGKASRHLWPSACDIDNSPLTGVAALPPVGNIRATRYALQMLLAAHLTSGNNDAFDLARLAGDALDQRKGPDGQWSLIEDPNNRYPRPASVPMPENVSVPEGNTEWPRGDWGLPATLRTLADVRILKRDAFNKLTSRTLPTEVFFAAMVTGLTDQLPSADLPLSAAQLPAYMQAHPELLATLNGPEPISLSPRLQRLWTLYLLATLETRFTTPSPVKP